MASKVTAHPLNGMHTAGIFSDMTVDGPLIGTLVVVVDRAKNLPNRKSIGKQDPYCAARLGKEAKKTTTDVRGGQTPKWDQELRFTVFDSPDYYQLKLSVFNDDKRTDLIGESWIDLREIIVPGGGQKDLWNQLACKGKYAGEIRIEITFYDTRPKPEKPAIKAKPSLPSVADASRTQQRSPPKRRPLPSDPVTGKAPASSGTDHYQTPPRHQPTPPTSYIPSQSPLQHVEYNTPPSSNQYPQPDQYHAVDGVYGRPTQRTESPLPIHETPDPYDSYSFNPDDSTHRDRYREHSYDNQNDVFGMDNSPMADHEDRPPPPPVHRNLNSAGATYDQGARSGFDGSGTAMRHDVLRNEAHRHSVPSTYPGRPTYKAFDSAPAAPQVHQSPSGGHHLPSPPRHHSYDSAFDPSPRSLHHGSDADPQSPNSMIVNSFRSSGSNVPDREPDFDFAASPAPLNLGGRGSATSGHFSNQRRQNSDMYTQHSSPISPGNFVDSSPTSRSPYGSHEQSLLSHRGERLDTPNSYALPPVPPSLVPGVDPSLAHEISQRIQEDRRHDRRFTQPANSTPPRGRQMNDGYRSLDNGPALNGTPPQGHGRGPTTFSGGPNTSNTIKPRAMSTDPTREQRPNPHHHIRRKSVSPAPPADDRRLSGVPFGPDSYNALNPTVARSSAKAREPVTVRPDYHEIRGKILSHDGREIDPSDHLPMESWAPEPEPKNKTNPPTTPNARSSPAGPQSLPNSGQRQFRGSGRPNSMAPAGSGYTSHDISFGDSPSTGASPPSSAGRNRLQKKPAHRNSAMPIMSGANGSTFASNGGSPLAPLPYPPNQHHDSFTPPRALPRASTFDYPSENYAPTYGSSPLDGHRGSGVRGHGGTSSAPPVPAKVPLGSSMPGMSAGSMMSGALSAGSRNGYDEWGASRGGRGGYSSHGHHGRGASAGGDVSLAEEMQRIDIGTGRARRHGQAVYY